MKTESGPVTETFADGSQITYRNRRERKHKIERLERQRAENLAHAARPPEPQAA